MSAHALRQLVSAGFVRRMTRTVYAAAQMPDTRENRRRALQLCAPPGSVICDWTACWLWTGVDRPGRHLATEIDAFRLRGHDRIRNGLVESGERSFSPSDVEWIDERLMISTPLRTAWDLGRLNAPVVAMGGMDALHRSGGFRLGELEEGLPRFKGHRGVVGLRWLVSRVDGRAESPGESALRVRWHEAGLPSPELQIPVLDNGRELYRLDLGLESLGLAAEYDGEEFHAAEHAAADRARRDDLARRFGWRVEAFRREDVFGPGRDVEQRLAALAREVRRSLHLRR